MITTTLSVLGMTCDACVKNVTEELEEVEGVLRVDVELGDAEISLVRVLSEDLIDADLLDAAIDEAGYEVVRA